MGDVYRAIGEFVTSFEQVCSALQSGIIFILHQEGLKNQKIAHVILAGMTAEPLTSLYAAMVAESQGLTDGEQKLVDGVLTRFRELTKVRNDILHSTWFVGYGNKDTIDWSVAETMKYHKNKKGAVYKTGEYSSDNLRPHITEANELAAVVNRLLACFLGDRSIIRNFTISADGKMSVPSSS